LSGPAQQLSWLINAAGETSAGLQRTFEVLDMKPEIRSPSQPGHAAGLAGEVTFENVSFRYRDEKAHALHDINLNVSPTRSSR
jgi:ABC-type bacteriocin/lantibiotic exporter with double-glycine peptidase domain